MDAKKTWIPALTGCVLVLLVLSAGLLSVGCSSVCLGAAGEESRGRAASDHPARPENAREVELPERNLLRYRLMIDRTLWHWLLGDPALSTSQHFIGTGLDYRYDQKQPPDKLLQLLENPRAEGRRRGSAALNLGRMGYTKAVPAMLKIIESPASGDSWEFDELTLRHEVIRALGNLRDNRATPALLQVTVEPGDPGVFLNTRLLYSYYGGEDPLHPELAGRPPLDKRLWPLLVTGHARVLEITAYEAVLALGEIGDSSAVPDLITLLSDPEWRFRSLLVGALGRIGDPRALPALRRTATAAEERGESSLAERARAAIVAIEGRSKTRAELLQDLRSPDAATVYFAIRRLQEKGDRSAVPELRKLVNDSRTFSPPPRPGYSVSYTLGYAAYRAIELIQRGSSQS